MDLHIQWRTTPWLRRLMATKPAAQPGAIPMNTSTNVMCRSRRQGFTALEMLVVLGIIFVLVAMTMPSIFSAIRKGRIHDAANAIGYVSSQARQLARASLPLPVGAPARCYGVALVPPTATSPGYAALVFGGPAPGDAIEVMSNGRNVSRFAFNRNALLYKGDDFINSTPLSSGSRIVWYYQNQTGLPLQNAGDMTASGIGTQGQAAQTDAFGKLISPAVALSPVCGSLSVRSLDCVINASGRVSQGYAVAVAIYHVGLSNVLDM